MNRNFDLVFRYLVILIFGLGNLYLIYSLFYPLTFYSVSYILSFFGETINFYELKLILFKDIVIELVNACIAGSAYFLLLILNLSTPNIKILKRVWILLFCFFFLFFLNVLRIVFMVFIAKENYFNFVHMGFWYVISIIFVVFVWFSAVRLFRIKEIPLYTDFYNLYKEISNSKKRKKHK